MWLDSFSFFSLFLIKYLKCKFWNIDLHFVPIRVTRSKLGMKNSKRKFNFYNKRKKNCFLFYIFIVISKINFYRISLPYYIFSSIKEIKCYMFFFWIKQKKNGNLNSIWKYYLKISFYFIQVLFQNIKYYFISWLR